MPRFFSTDTVRNITRGSYEHIIARLEEALERSKLFEGTDSYVLGTFSGYALAASEEGECLRLRYEDTGNSIDILSHEKVDISSYKSDDIRSFLEDESANILSLWESGKLVEAENKLRSVITVSKQWFPKNENVTFSKWVESLTQTRPWLTLLEDKKEQIESTFSQKSDKKIFPKFRKLYDESIEDLESFRGLVESHYSTITGYVGDLHVEVSKTVAQLEQLVSEFDNTRSVTSLMAFAADLLEDISRIDTIAKESINNISRVDYLSEVYDTMAIRLSRAEDAHTFVQIMAERLATPLSGVK